MSGVRLGLQAPGTCLSEGETGGKKQLSRKGLTDVQEAIEATPEICLPWRSRKASWRRQTGRGGDLFGEAPRMRTEAVVRAPVLSLLFGLSAA